MPDTAIRVEALSKAYRIGQKERRDDTIIGTLTSMARAPFENFRKLRKLTEFSDSVGRNGRPAPSGNGAAPVSDVVWAVKDISFEIKSGEVVGLVGRNGAGKSTLLKILSRITPPTSGRALIYGQVASLLEVGTGFHADLSGRENVYLNGTILGMTRKEVDRKFDQIVDFSGVEKFIDTPVKRYSSGMRVRLAFAVAAHLEPEILLIDEVLAVGDADFQKRCLGKMSEVAQAGRTVVFVSHNLGSVTQLCHRGIWIEKGQVRADGPVERVVTDYLGSLSDQPFDYFDERHGMAIEGVRLRGPGGRLTAEFQPGDEMSVEIAYRADRPISNPSFLVKIESSMGACFTANMLLDGHRPEVIEGRGTVTCRFRSIPLLPRTYTVILSVRTGLNDAVMSAREVASFTVSGDLGRCGFKGDLLAATSRATPVVVPYEWAFSDGTRAEVALTARDPVDGLSE